jgi:hypothetical protein
VNGARTAGAIGGDQTGVSMPSYAPKERTARADVVQQQVHVGDAFAPDSCMITGRHRFELPPALGGRPPSRTIEGECTSCGLVKRFAATPGAAARKMSRLPATQRPVELPPIARSGELDVRVLFDALCHLGHGSYHDLERIASQVEGSGLYADKFVRAQEALGHIDVRRDEYLRVSDWAVNAPTIVPADRGRWILVGSHSQRMLSELRKIFGYESIVEHQDRGALRVEMTVDTDLLNSHIDELVRLEIELRQSSTVLGIAAALPPLSQIETGLKRVSIPAYRTLEKWNTQSATWIPSDSLASVGAYRLREFQSLYVVRSELDLGNETAAVGTAQLVKHVANRWADDPLVGYHNRTRSVLVPLGADLPGLYGRALALCSGIAPVEHLKGRMVQYPDVPREIADVLFDRLTR